MKEQEKAIRKLWKSGKYTTETELASRIGLTEEWVKFIINLQKIRETIGISRELKIYQKLK